MEPHGGGAARELDAALPAWSCPIETGEATSFHSGYFAVNPDAGDRFIDWEWPALPPARSETARVRHLRPQRPVMVQMDDRSGEGVILKP